MAAVEDVPLVPAENMVWVVFLSEQIRGGRAFAGGAALPAEHHRERLVHGGQNGYSVVLDERIGHHVERGTDAEVVVEANRVWTVGDWLAEVHVPAVGALLDHVAELR